METVPEPKYWHLKTVLSDALDSEFAVGEILPNERELAARFGVARATLRQALEQLELEGRLQRRRGVGTTVAPPRFGVGIGPAGEGPFADAEGGWQTEGGGETVPPAAVARLLETPAGARVFALRRTRVTHGQPVATELLYVPEQAVPEETPEGDEAARRVLAALGRLGLESQERSVELGSVRAEDARRLDRLPGAPVLVVTTRYAAQDGPAVVAVSTYRADTCRLTFADSGAEALAG
nr:GntR family transcriptional regulator [Streptomyces sp. HNM0574]